jgi:hypothetical protein
MKLALSERGELEVGQQAHQLVIGRRLSVLSVRFGSVEL